MADPPKDPPGGEHSGSGQARPDPQLPPHPLTPPPTKDDKDGDWLFSWARSTRQAAPEHPKQPRPRLSKLRPRRMVSASSDAHEPTGRSLWRATAPKFGPLLERVERRRLIPILDGSTVRQIETPDGTRPALVHRHWAGLVIRLLGAVAALVVAIFFTPALLALIVLTGSHGLLVAARRGIKQHVGGIVGGLEFAVGLLIGTYLGEGWLRLALIVGTLITTALTVVAWQVDMEFVTEGGRLVRTRGLFLLKRTVAAPLSSIRIADIMGPVLGLGLVTVDTTSDRDQLLHDFGLIGQPNEWAALLLREAARPSAAVKGK